MLKSTVAANMVRGAQSLYQLIDGAFLRQNVSTIDVQLYFEYAGNGQAGSIEMKQPRATCWPFSHATCNGELSLNSSPQILRSNLDHLVTAAKKLRYS